MSITKVSYQRWTKGTEWQVRIPMSFRKRLRYDLANDEVISRRLQLFIAFRGSLKWRARYVGFSFRAGLV